MDPRPVVLVTGSAQRIGRAIALELAAAGWRVAVHHRRSAAEAAQTVSAIAAAGSQALAFVADLAQEDAAEALVPAVAQAFGRIDAVVNNAGILRDRMFHKMSGVEWREVIDVHLNGYFNVSKAAAAHFKEQGSGAYVHFTSTSGLIGNIGQANYSAAKMGIVGLSNSIALDMQRFGVRSNCIAPFAWSRMTASIPAETEADRQRLERLKSMSADKIAPLVAFLCADASREVTGQIFCVRKNEIFLFSMPRPVRSMHRSDGWTVESIASDLLPAFKPSMTPLQRSSDIFAWDPA